MTGLRYVAQFGYRQVGAQVKVSQFGRAENFNTPAGCQLLLEFEVVLRQRSPGESAQVALKSDDFAQVVLGRLKLAEEGTAELA